jgi:hypothetical protein
MTLEEQCFAELDMLYPQMEPTKNHFEIDQDLAALLNILYLDDIRRENKKRANNGLTKINAADIVNEWHVARRLVPIQPSVPC